MEGDRALRVVWLLMDGGGRGRGQGADRGTGGASSARLADVALEVADNHGDDVLEHKGERDHGQRRRHGAPVRLPEGLRVDVGDAAGGEHPEAEEDAGKEDPVDRVEGLGAGEVAHAAEGPREGRGAEPKRNAGEALERFPAAGEVCHKQAVVEEQIRPGSKPCAALACPQEGRGWVGERGLPTFKETSSVNLNRLSLSLSLCPRPHHTKDTAVTKGSSHERSHPASSQPLRRLKHHHHQARTKYSS